MALILVSLSVLAYALFSRRLASTPVTGAMIFMVLGVTFGPAGFGVIEGAKDRHAIALLLEVALALVLFTDALAISAGDWRTKSRLPTRLLLIGMPLTILLGWGVGIVVLSEIDVWEVALVAICLAPTDAALGQAVVTSPKVPGAIRQALNIESGLNDGLALPFFLLALTAAAETEGIEGPGLLEVLARSLVLAAIAGAAAGWFGAHALAFCRRRGWVGREWGQIATLALVLLAFAVADAADGSGFIATWVAGVAFGRATRERMPDAALLAEDLGGLLAQLSFLGFGAVLLGPILDDLSWRPAVYALLSLTVIRMVPVAASLVGTGLSRSTLAFAGWFGPRGLASIVFGLFVAEEALPNEPVILEAVFVTVALSVVVHGATAVWGARRYGAWYERAVARGVALPEAQDVGEPRVRRRLAGHEAAARPPDPTH
ncbi:MAG: cation:proton antiporter [Actinomycetota bacterium]